jgi:hypothetical protein
MYTNSVHLNFVCEFSLNWNFNEKKNCYECTASDLNHNHPISEEHYKNYSYNRQLNEEEIKFVEPLLVANAELRDIVRQIKKKFHKDVTISDLQNLKYKLLTKPTKHLTETERLLKYLEENLKDKKVYVKHKINDKDELECLFVQTDYMEEWYNKYGHLMHIDGTYCVMVETFCCFIQYVKTKI